MDNVLFLLRMIGTTLSHYRIVSELGRGGMGIVYLAEDTKLDRQVAIKVLPPSALASEDDRARFYREAKAAAALNHPNIAQIYQIDEAVPEGGSGEEPRPFIAMEYIDGEPLESRIKKGPLKLKEAVRLASQIAGALGAAHEKGIVHRDVKASNVMLTSKGDAKVLDFGLALTAASTKLTRMGSTLGTVAYMSPEQARGEEVDRRTDLWALGVVLYEMVAGRNPFGGDYEQAVVYSILNAEPEPLTAVRTGVPMQLEWIANKCLAKSADDRYQNAEDLIVDLRNVDVMSGSSASGQSAAHRTVTRSGSTTFRATAPAPDAATGRSSVVPIMALILGILLASGWFLLRQPDSEPEPMTRVSIRLPEILSARFSQLSPTREYLAFEGSNRAGDRGLFVRDMRTGQIRVVPGTNNLGNRGFGFSPDGTRIAYTQSTNDGVYVVEIPSGIPVQVTSPGRFAFWLDNSTIAITDDRSGGGDSYLIDVDSFEKTKIEINDPQLEEGYGNILKTIVPGTDRAFGIQLIRNEQGGADQTDPVNLFTLDLSSGELDIIARNASNVEYLTDNVLGYQIGNDTGELMVRTFDPRTGEFRGAPRGLTELGVNQNWGDYSFTTGGDVLYVGSGQDFFIRVGLFELDMEERSAKRLPLLLPEPLAPRNPKYSPDDDRVAFNDSENRDTYDFNLRTGQQTQFTYDGNAVLPAYGPSGEYIYYTSVDTTAGPAKLMRVPLGNVAGAERVEEGLRGAEFSDDGRYMAGLIFDENGSENEVDRFAVVDRQSNSILVLDSSRTGPRFPGFSPDGRYIAHMSELTFTSPIIVHSTDGRQRIQLPGIFGTFPRFSPDGEWLYFGGQVGVFRVPIRLNPSFAVTGPQEQVIVSRLTNAFDLTSDGSTIVLSAQTADFASDAASETEDVELVWLQNFPEFLRDELGE